MAQRGRLRRQHLRDFESRRTDDSVLAFRNSEYILVHPFADDHALLAQIGGSSDQCCKVDAYWRIYDDVVFLEVSSATVGSRRPGRYGRWSPSQNKLNLQVTVEAATITRALFEAELARLVDKGVVGRALARGRRLGASLVPV
jgi:hypothetical protein